ncbi:low molecular weight protein-tyrosine-phosphatase [Croceicoccus naphthovorans]|uniref:protein-tyrosine-phosphatase n=1 Tax=Croceicoccus naphthovorans TaxID=1348774 RepID=A0A0G3XGN5_9SPHN|nr:low molecular weight protein-tyrosine-phosphatase [Croceicoccus naphthovorans]AKM10367.1 phosphotyrosine protein phosphatase [Croceicoccus naphthovorans]MBB3990060.1 protein-tyrosine phosphatase [Croceicoccus naphthovorans]
MNDTPRILFVCLGNICRSPLAEAALRAEADRAGLTIAVDSAGTGAWHVGNPPDPRAISEAARNGMDIAHYRARQVGRNDFTAFTHIYALDADNLANLRRMRPSDGTAALALLLDEVPGRTGEAVADPYYGDDSGFAVTWADVSAAARAIVARLR